MKSIIIVLALFATVSFASETDAIKAKKLLQEQVKKQMQKEKKFAEERTFYQGSEYNLKAQEVNPASLINLPEIENEDDFDMDSVYD